MDALDENEALWRAFTMFLKSQVPLVFFFVMTFISWKYSQQITRRTRPSGIHYFKHKRRELKRYCTAHNPFNFEVDITTVTTSEIKCNLKCDGVCYVQALWGVPIFDLFELLRKDWLDIINSVTRHEQEAFSFKCKHAEEPFILDNNVEEVIKFQLPSDFNKAVLIDKAVHSRTIYPFVLLMVLKVQEEELKYPKPYVIAHVNVLHLPDDVLNKAKIIGHFSRLSSGEIGQQIKTYVRSDEVCLICYQKPASVLQLSCRHSCLCRTCYEKCDKCPLCRNPIMDFVEFPDDTDTDTDSVHLKVV